MKLLILTQKIDRQDPVLGFFHRWVEEFAKHCERVVVICLQRGDFDLPKNVKVLSLGKESGRSRFKYIWRFYKYIWRERKNYDVVFAHMNQEYVILGSWLWKLWSKKIWLWRNHAYGNLWTRLAVWLSDRVFCTSPQSFTAQFKKTELMPVGIDTDYFKPNQAIKKVPNSILSLGRISPVKRLEVLIDTLLELDKWGIGFSATVVGSPTSEADRQYEQDLRKQAEPLIHSGRLKLLPAVSNAEAKILYNQHEIFVNLTPAGSMDKTIFEAMACELDVIIEDAETKNLAREFVNCLADDREKRAARGLAARQEIVAKHSLVGLIRVLGL